MSNSSSWAQLHSQLDQTLRQRQLLPKSAALLIALSGGQDSLCLTKLLLDLQAKWQWQLAIAHCDHGWSSDVGIADYVAKIAHNWQLPFYLKTTLNLAETEAAAREWRYQALGEIATTEGYSYILTGHTQSDRAETFLYNLIRGTGSNGLQALSWKRSLTEEIELVRPLLNISRQETGLFCQQLQLPIWEDVQNQNPRYARNRIRTEVIPYLQTHFNPQVEKAIAQTAEILQAEVFYLEQEAQKQLQKAISTESNRINRYYLRQLPLAIQRRVIRQFLAQFTSKSFNFEQIESIVQLIHAPNRSCTSSLPGKIIATVEGESIIVILKI